MTTELVIGLMVFLVFMLILINLYQMWNNHTWKKYEEISNKLFAIQKEKIELKKKANFANQTLENVLTGIVYPNRFLVAYDEQLNILSCVEYYWHIDKNNRLTSKFYIKMLENNVLKTVHTSNIFDYEFLSVYSELVLKDTNVVNIANTIQQDYLLDVYGSIAKQTAQSTWRK